MNRRKKAVKKKAVKKKVVKRKVVKKKVVKRKVVKRKAVKEISTNITVLTLAEAAKFLRVSQETMYNICRAKQIPCRQVGRLWRFSKGALIEWLTTIITPKKGKRCGTRKTHKPRNNKRRRSRV